MFAISYIYLYFLIYEFIDDESSFVYEHLSFHNSLETTINVGNKSK